MPSVDGIHYGADPYGVDSAAEPALLSHPFAQTYPVLH